MKNEAQLITRINAYQDVSDVVHMTLSPCGTGMYVVDKQKAKVRNIFATIMKLLEC